MTSIRSDHQFSEMNRYIAGNESDELEVTSNSSSSESYTEMTESCQVQSRVSKKADYTKLLARDSNLNTHLITSKQSSSMTVPLNEEKKMEATNASKLTLKKLSSKISSSSNVLCTKNYHNSGIPLPPRKESSLKNFSVKTLLTPASMPECAMVEGRHPSLNEQSQDSQLVVPDAPSLSTDSKKIKSSVNENNRRGDQSKKQSLIFNCQ